MIYFTWISCAFGFQELPLAVFKTMHCFCTWMSSVFSLKQQSDLQRCVETTALNRTTNSSTPTAPTELDHYQVYHTPVLGEILVVHCLFSHPFQSHGASFDLQMYRRGVDDVFETIPFL